MSDHLIDQLVGDLEPRQPLVNLKLWMHCTGCFFIIAAAVLATLGLRPDFATALSAGVMLWKPGLFFLAWIGSLMMVTDLSRPFGKIRGWHVVPLVFAAAILIWQFITQFQHYPLARMLAALKDPYALVCFTVIFGGGGMVLAIIWRVWLKKTASPNPRLLGALAGFSTGCLAATAYALHCDRDFALYISLYYGASVLGLTVVGAVLGQKWLNW